MTYSTTERGNFAGEEVKILKFHNSCVKPGKSLKEVGNAASFPSWFLSEKTSLKYLNTNKEVK